MEKIIRKSSEIKKLLFFLPLIIQKINEMSKIRQKNRIKTKKYCQNFDNAQAKIQYIGKMHKEI